MALPSSTRKCTLVWRDAEGRARTELVGKSTAGTEYDFVSVYEPVKRVHWTWSAVSKPENRVVHVRTFAESESPAPCPTPPTPRTLTAETPRRSPGSGFSTVERLPPTTINGIPVLGNRNTLVIPADTYGNEAKPPGRVSFGYPPISGSSCAILWTIRALGKLITELSDVKRSVPDPALFKVPKGYEMRVGPATPSLSSRRDNARYKARPSQATVQVKNGSNAFQPEG